MTSIEDLAINENFEVYIDARGDLAHVSGRDAFEQEIAIRITDRYNEIISETDKDTARNLVQLEARRVAEDMDRLDRVASITANYDPDNNEKLLVNIVYATGEEAVIEA
jgi:hypothetical protein